MKPDRLKKGCKSDDVKFDARSCDGTKTIKFDEVFEKDEFDMIFKDKGLLIQPTPTNKPTSTVTIIEFVSLPSCLGLSWSLEGFYSLMEYWWCF